MFGVSAVEAAVLLLWAAGVIFAVVGALSRAFSVRDTIVAIAIALFVPVIGSIGAIALYAYVTRRAPRRVQRASA